jgi:hypothetical protein
MKCDFKPSTEPDENGFKRWKCARPECGFQTGPTPHGPELFRNFPSCRVPGLGDYAAHWLTILTGITKADLTRWLGKDCGCDGRQEKLNTWGERLRAWWLGQ